MSEREIYSNLLPENAFRAAVINTDTTTNGEIIDTQDSDGGVLFIMSVGVVTLGDITPLIMESDSSTFASGNTNVADANLVGSAATGQEAAANMDTTGQVFAIGVAGQTKRYLRLSYVSANSCNLLASAVVVKNMELKSVY